MKAAVLYGKEDVRIETVKEHKLKPGEVRIGIEAALTCGTDLKVYKRGYHARMIVPPAVFGHELSGIITEICPPKEEAHPFPWKVGDHVVPANSAPCGKCFYCQQGQDNLCDDLLFLNGAYAETIVVPARVVEKNLYKLKRTTDFKDAALTEPLACVVQGVIDSRLQKGQRVLVIGNGPIGLMFIALAHRLGCDVTSAGRGENRLKAARRLGAQHVVDVGLDSNTVRAVTAATPHPFDVVIEAVGRPETWQDAIHLVRKGGLVNLFGGCPQGTSVTLDTGRMHYLNLYLVASFHHTPRSIRKALDYIEEGVITAKDFVDGEWTLSQLPELFHSMSTGNRSVKSLIRVKS
jgi:L-iditol 2-dehydrogenase